MIDVEKNINYSFKDKALLEQALTHSSTSQDKSYDKDSNQRLEFLGDSVLELVFTHFLYDFYPHLEEGILTKMRSQLVSQKTLSKIAEDLQLHNYLVLSKSAKTMGDHLRLSTLCDTFEALVAAIYLDSSYGKVEEILKPIIMPLVKEAIQWSKGNFKSLVQEYTQKNFTQLPDYRLHSVEGEKHQPNYTTHLYINNQYKTTGEGKTKKTAELDAAEKFVNLNHLHLNN